MSKHSTTPFYSEDARGCASLFDADGQEIAYLTGLADDDENEANKVFIINACNSHDPLLAALKSLCRFPDTWANDPTGEIRAACWRESVAGAEEVLADAEKEQP